MRGAMQMILMLFAFAPRVSESTEKDAAEIPLFRNSVLINLMPRPCSTATGSPGTILASLSPDFPRQQTNGRLICR